MKKRRDEISPDKDINAPLVANQSRTVIQSINRFLDVFKMLLYGGAPG